MSECSEDRISCVASHFCEALEGRREVVGWRMRCPVCEVRRALSVRVNGSVIIWNCHHKPACDRADIREALARLLPGCVTPGKSRRSAIDRQALIDLASFDLPKTALRVAILQLAGIGPAEARQRLGIKESTYYDALRDLALRKSGGNRRSG